MTISRKYRSYGIRRLNNFSDLSNPEQALDNLLNNLQEDPERSFISRDIDAIRGLKDTEIFPSTFTEIAATAPTYTFANTSGPQVDFVRPIIRVQDRFNTYRSITGAAGKQGAGYGPDAWTIPVTSFKLSPVKGDGIDDIIPNFSTDKSNFFFRPDFWAVGEVFVTNTFHPSFTNGKGGIVWESFYIPDYSTTGNALSFTTTGMIHIEFDRFDTGDWIAYKSIYAPERAVRVVANNNTSTTVEIAVGDEIYVAQGDKLTTNNEIQIIDIARNVLTLSSPINAVANDVISFEFVVGEDVVSDELYIEPVFDIGERPKIRIAWWYPNNISDPSDKYLSLRRNGNIMPFSNFSNTSSYSTGPYELQSLLDKAVTGYQPKFGDSGAYKRFRTDGVMRNTYVPPSNFSSINKFGANTSAIGQFVGGRRYVLASPARLADTSVGNIIVDTTPRFSIVSKDTRIKRSPSDNPFTGARILTKPATATANVSIRAIDHNGLVDYFITSSSNTMIKVDSTSNLRTGMLCVTHFTSPSTYYRISAIANTTTFFVTSPLGITSNNYVFVYSDSGLVDDSKKVYCQGVIGKLLTATATSGANTIIVDSTSGIVAGMRVQYTGGIDPVSNYTVATVVNGSQIRLNKGISETIDKGATVTFAPSGSTGDKQQCVIPLDLSPPFIGTVYGLDSGGRRIVGVSTANLDVTVLALSSNTAVVSAANTSDIYSAYISVNGVYKIKARMVT